MINAKVNPLYWVGRLFAWIALRSPVIYTGYRSGVLKHYEEIDKTALEMMEDPPPIACVVFRRYKVRAEVIEWTFIAIAALVTFAVCLAARQILIAPHIDGVLK